MTLPIRPPLAPMEAILVSEIPRGTGWQYEPKWDGFRCIVFKDGDEVHLQSKSGQPIGRFFPEVIENVRGLAARSCVLDTEILTPVDGKMSYENLEQRIHPAASRVARLAAEHPALLIAFDLLVDEARRSLLPLPLGERRERLASFVRSSCRGRPVGASDLSGLVLSPATTDVTEAQDWFDRTKGAIDGLMAKRLDEPYRSGQRAGMVKIKHRRTADCVVGGFRLTTRGDAAGSLLLGLHEGGLLHHVGFTSSFKAAERPALLQRLAPLRGGGGFSGRAPAGPGRWDERSAWVPVEPRLVVEVEYDRASGGRFRHGTRLLRWRPDKNPDQCTMDQLTAVSALQLSALFEPR